MPSRKRVKSGGHGERGCCRVLKQKHWLGSGHQPFMWLRLPGLLQGAVGTQSGHGEEPIQDWGLMLGLGCKMGDLGKQQLDKTPESLHELGPGKS